MGDLDQERPRLFHSHPCGAHWASSADICSLAFSSCPNRFHLSEPCPSFSLGWEGSHSGKLELGSRCLYAVVQPNCDSPLQSDITAQKTEGSSGPKDCMTLSQLPPPPRVVFLRMKGRGVSCSDISCLCLSADNHHGGGV